MVAVIVFHVLMIVLGIGIVSRAIPEKLLCNVLGNLHSTIGITTPPMEFVRPITLVWIGTTIVIVDGFLFLLVLITKSSN